MLPKRIRRTIKVNNDEYEYCIVGCINIFIRNLRTKVSIKWWDDWKPKWKNPIKPSDIRTLIETKELFGIKARE